MTGTRRRDPAAALLLAMAALVILGALGAALASAVLRGVAATREAAARDSLLNIAESGVDLAISKLARDPAWRGGDAVAVPGGACSIAVARLDEGAFEITSRALAEPRPGRTRGVQARVRSTREGLLGLSAWKRIK